MPVNRDILSIADVSSYDFTCTAGRLRIKTPAFVNDQTGGNTPGVYITPITLPVDPADNAVLVEVFDDCAVWWVFDAVTSLWTEEVRFCETVTTIVDNGDGTLTYTDEEGNPTTLSICTMLGDCTPTANAVDDVVVGTIAGQRLTGGVSANDTLCSIGTTSFALTGVPVNVTISFFDQSSGVYTILPTAAGAWSFQYNILCNGVVIDTATVSGAAAAITANAVNDIIPIDIFTGFVGDNDTGCSTGITRYKLTGAPVNGTVTTFNEGTGGFTFTPTQDGIWSFDYEIYCVVDNVEQGPIDTATVTGSYSGDLCNCSGGVSVTSGYIRINNVGQTGGAGSSTISLITINIATGYTTVDIDWGDATNSLGVLDATVSTHTYGAAGFYTISISVPGGEVFSQLFVEVTGAGRLRYLTGALFPLNPALNGGFLQGTVGPLTFRGCPASEIADVDFSAFYGEIASTGIIAVLEVYIDGTLVGTYNNYNTFTAPIVTVLNGWTGGVGAKDYEMRIINNNQINAKIVGILSATC